MFLPESIMILLSNLCEIDEESTHALWTYLKDTVWEYADKAKTVNKRFKLFGRGLGYGKFYVLVQSIITRLVYLVASLYPPVNYCTNDICDRRTKCLKLQKTDQTHGILYTLDKGIRPVWVIRFQCEGMSHRMFIEIRPHAHISIRVSDCLLS